MECSKNTFLLGLFGLHRPLEGAEENVRRLAGKKDLVLPYPQCCPTNKEFHATCSSCGVRLILYVLIFVPLIRMEFQLLKSNHWITLTAVEYLC